MCMDNVVIVMDAMFMIIDALMYDYLCMDNTIYVMSYDVMYVN